MISSVRRKLAVLPVLLLPLAAAAACSSENATTDCKGNTCTVTFNRGVDASASILGVKVEMVGVQGDNVTFKVGSQQLTVPVSDGGQQADGGVDVDVTSVTKDKVVAKISLNP
ncbi:hypothetical protein [Actinomadura kijaniata]|uniref:hypothetical protein n=1 Tax=Actinomadura kijaniata TaxID=46161 RepID=UPI0008364D2E|nr:hypothetical protein [Actinomadura kijaniata]